MKFFKIIKLASFLHYKKNFVSYYIYREEYSQAKKPGHVMHGIFTKCDNEYQEATKSRNKTNRVEQSPSRNSSAASIDDGTASTEELLKLGKQQRDY